ncbi:hypothetical protein BDV19DRAFT_84102 [Aspergillus venezuelensis]
MILSSLSGYQRFHSESRRILGGIDCRIVIPRYPRPAPHVGLSLSLSFFAVIILLQPFSLFFPSSSFRLSASPSDSHDLQHLEFGSHL